MTYLKQRVSSNDSQEAFESLSTGVDDFVRKAVREDFARERRDGHAGGLSLEDVAEGFKVGIAPSDGGVAQFEGGDVRLFRFGSGFDW